MLIIADFRKSGRWVQVSGKKCVSSREGHSHSAKLKSPPSFFWLCHLWDLSSLTRDWTQAVAVKALSPNHWSARESPKILFLKNSKNKVLTKSGLVPRSIEDKTKWGNIVRQVIFVESNCLSSRQEGEKNLHCEESENWPIPLPEEK